MAHKKVMDRCEEIREWLFPYLKGDLSPVLSKGVERHLQSCSRCRNELMLLRELQRLEMTGKRGAVDPAVFIEELNSAAGSMPATFPTVKNVIRDMEAICGDSARESGEKTMQLLSIIHSFLTQTRTFLQSRNRIRAGREWIQLEKRRAALLTQVLQHPCTRFLKDVIRLQAEAYVSRGLIFQIHGDTQNAEASLSLSVVLHWALNTSDDLQTQRFLGELKYYEGDLDAAEYLFLESLGHQTVDPREQAVLLRNLGNIEYSRGNLSGCRNYLEQAMTISLTLGLPDYPARDLMNLSVIDFSRGAVDSAEKKCREALDLLHLSTNVHLKGQLHANLGTFLAVTGQTEKASTQWNKAMLFFQNGYFLKDTVQVKRNIVLSDYENGHLDSAEKILVSALTEYSERDALLCQLHILMARIQRLNHRFSEARDHAGRAESIALECKEMLLLDAAILEQIFIALRDNRSSDLAQLISRSSASRKSKPINTPSIFDLENESLLVEVFRTLGDRRGAARCLRRLKRMLRQLRQLQPGSYACIQNAVGESWADILNRLTQESNNI
ncbi:zf-HC2 domain-containing protein [bacterium]|nr:zf-HC2 domain-containing protein [candidate division CSSED10-310 bacterium]